MSEVSLNSNVPNQEPRIESVETSGVIASNSTNTPSPLFSAVPSVETSGSIASSSPSLSGGSSTSFVC